MGLIRSFRVKIVSRLGIILSVALNKLPKNLAFSVLNFIKISKPAAQASTASPVVKMAMKDPTAKPNPKKSYNVKNASSKATSNPNVFTQPSTTTECQRTTSSTESSASPATPNAVKSIVESFIVLTSWRSSKSGM